MRTMILSHGSVRRCPIGSLSPTHYHESGACRCPLDGTVVAHEEGGPGEQWIIVSVTTDRPLPPVAGPVKVTLYG